MTGKNILGKLSLITLLALATQSCKKENGIDNNNVIQRPYVLYAADANGNVYKTNDGDNYNTVFSGDGVPLRALITSKLNMLIVKEKTVFFSKDAGETFDPIKLSNITIPLNIEWPFFILDVPSIDRIVSANAIAGDGNTSYSPDNGTYFLADTNWSKVDVPFTTESFTQTTNKLIYTYSISGSKNGVSKLYYKNGKDAPWMAQKNDLPDPFNFYLSHSGNTLIATDYDGIEGAWYSTDTGKKFKQYSGLPTGVMLYTTYAAYDKVLVGTEGMGVYMAEGGTNFVSSSSGLDLGTSVYSIVAKDNYYKNDALKKFIYIGTNTGIYRSEDLGKTWVKVKKDGDYRLLY